MVKKIKLIGIILFSFYASAFAQVKVDSNGGLFVNSLIGDWGRANWTRVHYQNTCAYHLQNIYYNSDVFYVIGDGRVMARLGYYTSSDGNFKTNVENVTDALTTVKKLRGVTYNRKYTTDSLALNGLSGNDTIIRIEKLEPREYGLIAQEVEAIVPEVVNKMPDSTLAISYSSIIPILIEAIKEQQNQIEKLEGLFEQSELEKKELQNSSQNNNGFGGNMTSNLFNNNCLYQNVPNPFNELTIINYYIDNNSKSASLNLYDLNGKIIKSVPIEILGKGEITINAGELKPGVYVYTLIVDGSLVDTKQMILTK